MPSKKTTPSADTGSKTLESPAPATSAPAKKRAGKGAKAAPKKEASKPAKPVKQVETEAIQETTSGAPEAASAYPFPPPPEALPWEGPGDALLRRKDQLEINRREREKLAELLGSAESHSAEAAQTPRANEEEAKAASAP